MEPAMCAPFVFASDAEIAAIGTGLLARDLPKAQWTHPAHFAAAVWLVQARGLTGALRDMPGIIRAYNVATCVANTATGGYHETITLASLRAAGAYVERGGGRLAFEITNEVLASALGRPDWVLAYWTRARLFSVAARLAWCEPDIEALPF